MSILSKIIGDSAEKYLKKLNPIVEEINGLEADFKHLNNEELKNKTNEFKERLVKGEETLDDLLPEAFAAVREAAKRTLNQRHFDVQLMGGIVLHQGKIAEMKTGEGKTLVATLPAYLNALTEKGAHIITVNDYLSRRDAVWMGQIYHSLGLKVGCINNDASYIYDPLHTEENLDAKRDIVGGFKIIHEFLKPCFRREAYQADITYGTNNEFGFDYLRDNLAYNLNQISQKNHNFAIIDEVDSILIDEARTPLIISSPDTESGELYKVFSRIAPRLIENEDYKIDEKMRAASITEKGIEKVEDMLHIKDIYTEHGIKYVHHLEQALRAQTLFHRDRDYVVKNGEAVIVDEFTGRLMPGRRWSEGLHQAIEAKEGVEIQKESRTVATITFQNYFRMYGKLSGMTGTAFTSAEEFSKVYNLEVVLIPTNKLLIRRDLNDQIFQTEKGKFMAVINQIKECNKRGQPVLVGTISIEKNELLSAMLGREGIKHVCLNAKNHEREAEIIAQAGKFAAVTIATNMAGRGVDIMLGGNPPNEEEARKTREAKGLFMFGTERHEARRIDNQLRGRSGRQGDPGATQFFVSLEDDLLRIFGSEKLKAMIGRFGIPEDEPIENSFITKAIESAQAKIEGFNFDARKYTLEYDDVMNKHRNKIYEMRKGILFGDRLFIEEKFRDIAREELDFVINIYTQGEKENWLNEEFISVLKDKLMMNDDYFFNIENIWKESGDPDDIREKIKDISRHYFEAIYSKKQEEMSNESGDSLTGKNNLSIVLQNLMLQIIDMFWIEHLETMEYMRSSVRLRAYGQRDPLIEYKNEAVRLFRDLERAIKSHIFFSFFSAFVPSPRKASKGHSKAAEDTRINTLSRNSVLQKPQEKLAVKIGRNEPCPCGSGKKYKKCHGA